MRKHWLLACLLMVGLSAFAVGCKDTPSGSGDSGGGDSSTPTCSHTTSAWTLQEEATCKAEGVEALLCGECEEVLDIRTIEKKAHVYDDEFLCHDRPCQNQNCDHVETATESHTAVGDAVYTAPTCNENGANVYTCECGEPISEIVPAYNLYSYGLYDTKTKSGWVIVNSTLDIGDNLNAAMMITATDADYGTTSLYVYMNPTDTLRIRVTDGRCDLKLKGANITEQVLAMGIVCGEYDIDLSEYITEAGLYELFVYPRGLAGSECVIDELSLLPEGINAYHEFDNGVCSVCDIQATAPRLSDNYGDLYAEEYAKRWVGSQHYALDETMATYQLSKNEMYLDSWLPVRLKPTDYIHFEIASGRFQIIVKDALGNNEIKHDFNTVGEYAISVEEYFEDTVTQEGSYQLWIVPLSEKGEESSCTIKDLQILEERPTLNYYGNLYGDSLKGLWKSGVNCDEKTNYFTMADGEATYTMDGSVTWYETKILQLTLKPTDVLSFEVVTGKIQVVIKSADGTQEVKTGDCGVGTHSSKMNEGFGSVVTKEGIYQLWIVPLTDANTPAEIKVKNLTLTEGEPVAENYGDLYAEEYLSKWTGSEHFEVENTIATYEMDGSVTWLDSYITVGLKTTDSISFKITSGKFRVIIKTADGQTEICSYIGGAALTSGEYTYSMSECNVIADGNYQLWIVPLTDEGQEATCTITNLEIIKQNKEV